MELAAVAFAMRSSVLGPDNTRVCPSRHERDHVGSDRGMVT